MIIPCQHRRAQPQETMVATAASIRFHQTTAKQRHQRTASPGLSSIVRSAQRATGFQRDLHNCL